jgi:hypothetical protein
MKFDDLYKKLMTENEEARDGIVNGSRSTFNGDVDGDLIEYVLMDNGDYEYNRFGVGSYEGETFITDLELDNDEGNIIWCKPGMSVQDVMDAGVSTGLFELTPEDMKYNDEDVYRYDIEDEGESFDKFVSLVSADGKGFPALVKAGIY